MDGRIITVDALAIVMAWIEADAVNLNATFGDPLRIGSKLDPTGEATLPAARLSRITSPAAVPNWLMAPVIEVDVWANDEVASFNAAALLQARMHDLAILGTHAGLGVITNLEVAQGIRQLADEDAPKLDRHIFATRYHAHPLPE